MTARFDARATATGAGVAVAVAALTMVAVQVVDTTVGLDHTSNWIFAFYGVVLAGLVTGGWVAARRRPDAPAVHGAAAALAAYAVVAAAGTVIRLVAGSDLDPVALAFNGLIAAAAGILGGLLADLRRRPTGVAEPQAPDRAVSQ